jgi:hypothetical protein
VTSEHREREAIQRELEQSFGIAQVKDQIQDLRNTMIYQGHHLSKTRHSQPKIYRWESLYETLGIRARVITSEKDSCSIRDTFVNFPVPLPFGYNQTMDVKLSFHGCWPSLPSIRLRPQRVIPVDSDIISACLRGDTTRAAILLRAGDAHPNDRTPENITVFRVSAIEENRGTIDIY